MKLNTISATTLFESGRLDSRFYLSQGISAAEKILRAKKRGIPCQTLGGSKGVAKIWQPNRFKRAYAAQDEESVAYLRPYDVFEYLPTSADLLSVKRNKDIASYILKRGMLLQSCSGRNLGPAVFVDSYLAKFVVGDDMIRLEIEDEKMRAYVLAFLQCPTGQQLLRQGKTGSVIDHISKNHIASLEIPIFDKDTQDKIYSAMSKAISYREQARIGIDSAVKEYEDKLPPINRKQLIYEGWTQNAKSLSNRLDAAFYDPLVKNIQKRLRSMGGVEVHEVADVIKPAGRYKTRYVESGYGLPIVSGTQLLQSTTINLRYMPASAFSDASGYMLKHRWIAYQADGRAEETLGLPVMITKDREGWLASGHVGRVVAKKNINAGWLFLALRTKHVQIQIKSTASGSVVDSTFPEDMENVVLPPEVDGINGDEVQRFWDLFSLAQEQESLAVSTMESALSELVTKRQKNA